MLTFLFPFYTNLHLLVSINVMKVLPVAKTVEGPPLGVSFEQQMLFQP